ncbi:MAG: FAD-binding protein [Boseongicola sp.]
MTWKTTEYSGWGRVHRATGDLARPERLSALKRICKERPAPAFGMRRSYGDACLNDGGAAIDMTRLDRILEFDAESGIVHVQAGAQIGEILKVFATKGWLPPVMPGTGFATIGGAIAMDVHGKNHHGAGSFGCHVVEISLMTPEGINVLTPNKNAGLFKATIGGLGQTGPIVSAKIQMLKAKGDVMVVTKRRVDGWDEFLTLLDASDATYSVGWIDATADGKDLGRGILEEAETGGGLVPRAKRGKRIPFNAPRITLSAPVVRAFNAAYWRQVPVSGRTVVMPIDDFFFPLDKIHDWNRLYGKSGFHQFQCVVPLSAADQLRAMLEQITASGLASPLAVLKRMGPGRAGYMSFPMEGYTLAVDFQNCVASEQLIGKLETATSESKGRLYLAKDSLAGAETIREMYPEHGNWLKAVEMADPDGLYETDLVRRLELRKA